MPGFSARGREILVHYMQYNSGKTKFGPEKVMVDHHPMLHKIYSMCRKSMKITMFNLYMS